MNVFVAVVTSVCHLIFTMPVKKLYESQKRVKRIVAIVYSALTIMLNLYLLLALSAIDLQDREKSSQWTLSFILQYLTDLLITQTIMIGLQYLFSIFLNRREQKEYNKFISLMKLVLLNDELDKQSKRLQLEKDEMDYIMENQPSKK